MAKIKVPAKQTKIATKDTKVKSTPQVDKITKAQQRLAERELKIKEQALDIQEARNKQVLSSLNSKKTSRPSSTFSKLTGKSAANLTQTQSEFGAIGLSMLTGGVINPVLIKELGGVQLAGKAIDKVGGFIGNSLNSISDSYSRNTAKQKAWAKRGLNSLFGKKTDGLEEEQARSTKKSISKKVGSAIEKSESDPVINRLDTIINLLGKPKTQETLQEKEEKKGFLDGLMGLFKGAGGMLAMGIAAGAIGSLFENPILPAAIAGGAIGLKFGGLHGLVAGALVGGAAGGILATSRDLDKRSKDAAKGEYKPPAKIGPVTYAQFTGILAGAMAGMAFGPVGILVGGVLGFAIGSIYDMVNNNKLMADAAQAELTNESKEYRDLKDLTKDSQTKYAEDVIAKLDELYESAENDRQRKAIRTQKQKLLKAQKEGKLSSDTIDSVLNNLQNDPSFTNIFSSQGREIQKFVKEQKSSTEYTNLKDLEKLSSTVEKRKDLMKEFDTDGDGKLSKQEVDELRDSRYWRGSTAKERDNLLSLVNENGEITKDAFYTDFNERIGKSNAMNNLQNTVIDASTSSATNSNLNLPSVPYETSGQITANANAQAISLGTGSAVNTANNVDNKKNFEQLSLQTEYLGKIADALNPDNINNVQINNISSDTGINAQNTGVR